MASDKGRKKRKAHGRCRCKCPYASAPFYKPSTGWQRIAYLQAFLHGQAYEIVCHKWFSRPWTIKAQKWSVQLLELAGCRIKFFGPVLSRVQRFHHIQPFQCIGFEESLSPDWNVDVQGPAAWCLAPAPHRQAKVFRRGIAPRCSIIAGTCRCMQSCGLPSPAGLESSNGKVPVMHKQTNSWYREGTFAITSEFGVAGSSSRKKLICKGFSKDRRRQRKVTVNDLTYPGHNRKTQG